MRLNFTPNKNKQLVISISISIKQVISYHGCACFNFGFAASSFNGNTTSSVYQYFKFQKPNTSFGLEFRVPSGELSTEEVPLCQEQLDHQ